MYKTMIIGNLGRDAKLRKSQNGAFLSFSVAASQAGKTVWFDCTLDGENPNLLPYLVKGVKVFCLGSQSSQLYQDGNGRMLISHNLRVNQLELCGSKDDKQGMQRADSSSVVDTATGEVRGGFSSNNSDVPF